MVALNLHQRPQPQIASSPGIWQRVRWCNTSSPITHSHILHTHVLYVFYTITLAQRVPETDREQTLKNSDKRETDLRPCRAKIHKRTHDNITSQTSLQNCHFNNNNAISNGGNKVVSSKMKLAHRFVWKCNRNHLFNHQKRHRIHFLHPI